jgi:hypothetical protein
MQRADYQAERAQRGGIYAWFRANWPRQADSLGKH